MRERTWGRDEEAERKLKKEVEKKGEEAREGRIEAKAHKIAAGGNERASIKGINEEQRCRVAMCEGATEKVREKERARERERE